MRDQAEQIRAYHAPQVPLAYGVGSARLEVRPLSAVGLYVPGGRAAYPSTVLMTAIPASLAGVSRLVLATPPHAPMNQRPMRR